MFGYHELRRCNALGGQTASAAAPLLRPVLLV